MTEGFWNGVALGIVGFMALELLAIIIGVYLIGRSSDGPPPLEENQMVEPRVTQVPNYPAWVISSEVNRK